MPLVIGLSAAAQYVGGGGILPEFVLGQAALAIAAGLTCCLAARYTRSIGLGVFAAALQVAIYPRQYNYPKLIVPLIALALLWRFIKRPSVARSALLGAWIAAAFLFRHDYLLYIGLATAAAFVPVTTVQPRRTTVIQAAACAGAALIVVAPYLLALTYLGGVNAHVRDALEFAKGEGNQWGARPPWFLVGSRDELPDRTTLAAAGRLRRAARKAVFDVARGFAAGHPYFIRRSFSSTDHQRRMVARLERESVPIALMNLDQGWFRQRFGILQVYIDSTYEVVGTYSLRGETIAIAVKRDRAPRGVYADTGWPCFSPSESFARLRAVDRAMASGARLRERQLTPAILCDPPRMSANYNPARFSEET